MTITETSDDLYRQGSTDGLPVVPPTEERVDEMLRGTDLPPDHAFGRLGNREGLLTVEKLAINGVMAGCRPIHMPVLVAGAKAMAEPDSSIIRIAVSTGSWAYFWLLNGPIRQALDVGTGSGAFGPGLRSNQTIGRALGLAYKNTALVHPGEKNMGVQGSPFQYSLVAGENEEASPWEPFHVSAGYDREDSTITFGGPNSFAQYGNRPSENARDVLKDMIYNTPSKLNRSDRSEHGVWAIHALAPEKASRLSEAGMSKQDVKRFLIENSDRIKAEHTNYTYGPDDDEEDGVSELRVPHRKDTKHVKIPVIGGEGRENAVIGPALPGVVTKRIEFPDNWESLLEEYAIERRGIEAEQDHAWLETARSRR